jgi:hypothetical protein
MSETISQFHNSGMVQGRQMKYIPYSLALIFLPLLMAACAGEESDASGAEQGPALIMFYTDN